MATPQSPLFKLSENDQCMLAEIRQALKIPDNQQANAALMLNLVTGTQAQSFPEAVQEGHRQLREEQGLIANSQCKIPKANTPRGR